MSNVKRSYNTSRRIRKGYEKRLNRLNVNAASKVQNQSFGWWVNDWKSLLDQENKVINLIFKIKSTVP